MSKSIALTLQMNTPCSENWNSMEPTEQGRFCNKCEKPVIDFTDFTDQQILQYFLKHPFPVCGRMLPSQRDNRYENATSKINRNLSPVAASLLTLAAITTEAAVPPSQPMVNIQQSQQPVNKQAIATPADSIVISGTVKNVLGAPLENVEIIFEEFKTLSDQNGNFQFVIPSDFNKPTVIQLMHPNLDKEVRSYHPAMGSTSFNVIMHKPYIPEPGVMGGIGPVFELPDPISTLFFTSSTTLDTKTRAILNDLATFLKDNPQYKITIKSYYNSSEQKAVKLSNRIKYFLADEQGVGSTRIMLATPHLRATNKSEVIIEFSGTHE